jgi:hypothetical protein
MDGLPGARETAVTIGCVVGGGGSTGQLRADAASLAVLACAVDLVDGGGAHGAVGTADLADAAGPVGGGA